MDVYDTTDIVIFIMVFLFASFVIANVYTHRTFKGKIARKIGSENVVLVYLGCVITIFASSVTTYARQITIVMYIIILILEIDDFFNGNGPRKKRFRKWAKNKLAKLKPARRPKFQPQPQPN